MAAIRRWDLQIDLVEMASRPLWLTFIILFAIVGVRYFLMAGAFFFYFYIWRREAWHNRRVEKRYQDPAQYRMEIYWSFWTSMIFAAAGAVVFKAWAAGHTAIYLDWQEYGTAYGVFSFFLLIFLHETYFYWTHRWMHIPSIFRKVHKVHHLSRNPSPWAAFSFHPYEGIIEAIILPALVFFIPVHPVVFLTFLMFMTIMGITNHLGVEIYPKGTATNWFGKWWIGPTHHYQHHAKVNCNYGLYFTFWDRLCGTQRADFEQLFAETTGEIPVADRESGNKLQNRNKEALA